MVDNKWIEQKNEKVSGEKCKQLVNLGKAYMRV